MADIPNTARILRSWVDQILASENDDDRFEEFANDLASILEGKTVVGTSKSWDAGRDGRGVGPAHGVFVVTTLRTDTKKARADAAKLKATAWKIRHVYYVAPRVVSDKVLEDHSAEIRSILGDDVPIDAIGSAQMSELVCDGKAAEPFRKHYAGELAAVRSASAVDTDDPELRHLELALSTFGAKDTQELRVGLGTRLVLQLLDKQPHSLKELAAGATASLGVDAFSESTVRYYCDMLAKDGDIGLNGPRYEINDKGRERLRAGGAGVAATALSGRDAVRRAVEESLGSAVADKQWDLIWPALQKALARAFYVRGKQMLDLVSALLKGDTSAVHRDILAVLVEDVLKSVVGTYVSAPQRGSMLRALQDAFLPGDKHGAFDWLAGVAGRFAATCTLGLPAEISSALANTLKKLRPFLDTDVVISYLCPHEPAHVAAQAVVKLNRRLGNDVMITDAVAEEAARHAMKAYTDYRVRVEPIKRALEWYEIADLESAFTREFESLRREGRVRPEQWPAFIARYAGEEVRRYGKPTAPNTSKMRTILSGESFAIRSSGEQTARWEEQRDALAKAIFKEAIALNPDGNAEILEHKARIDAEMLIAVSRTIAESEQKGTGEQYVLVTSARRLRYLSSEVRARLPDIPDVLTLAEAAALASFLPEQPVSLQALHGLLFEGHFARTVAPVEALLLRIVRESSSVVLPGATRGVLVEEFRASIMREASRTGEGPSEVRARIERNPVELAKIAAVALDALALTRPVDREQILRRLQEVVDAGKSSTDRQK
jgi:predicted nucleic acid-binding protein